MKRLFALVLVAMVMLCATALADTITIDLDTAEVEDLEALIVRLEERIVEIKEDVMAKHVEIDDIDSLFTDPSTVQFVRFPARVIQVAQGIGLTQLLTQWNGYEDYPFVVTYAPSKNTPVIAEGDAIEVYGEVTGITPVDGTDAISVTAYGINAASPMQLAAVGDSVEEGFTAVGSFSARAYQWATKYANWAALIVKNDSDGDLKASIDFIFRDEAGNMVGVTQREIQVIDPAQTSIVIVQNDSPFASFDYNITGSTPRSYSGILASLSADVLRNDKKLIISVTNTGDIPAEFAEGIVLFLKDGEVVDHDNTYFTDDDHEIKPESTIMKEISTREDFDAYLLYFDGRGDK